MSYQFTRGGHEPRIEPWLPVSTSLLAALSKLDGMVTISRETHENEQQANLLQGSETTVGWISRNSLHSGRGGAFFLTSLFIELIDPDRSPILDECGQRGHLPQEGGYQFSACTG